MSKKVIKCAKCQSNAETKPRWDEFTTTYPIRGKDGKIYCWDCYKSKSSCKGCGKSVANIKFPRSGQPEYPHCNGGVSYGCERISNNVEFICSKKCSKDIVNRKYQAWKDKLSQGWTKCEKCIKNVNKLIEWFNEDSMKGGEWLREEKHQSRFIKLVPPGQGKLCLEKWGCKWGEEVGKPRRKEMQAQAQKYWDTLPYETRIKEVIRSRNARQVGGWGGKFENLTAEQIAVQNEAPRGIVQEFELRGCHQDCSDCHLEKDFKNSSNNNNLSCSSRGNNSYNDNSEEKEHDQQSQENLRQANKNKLGNDYSGLIISGIVITSFISLAATILLIRKKKKNN